MLGTVPPHSDEAEQSVLGALLLDNGAFERVGDLLNESDFYHPDHRDIFATISGLIMANKAADIITVHEHGKHEPGYLNSLSSSVPSAANVRRYAEIVRERSIERQLMKECGKIIAATADKKVSAEEKLAQAQEAIASIAVHSSDQEPALMDATMATYIDTIEVRAEGRSEGVIPTGLHDLDRAMTGGLRTKRMYVIGARPSMGKTTIAMSIARYVAQQQGLGALVLSQEMPTDQLNDGSIAALGNIPLDKVLQPNLAHPDISDDEFWRRLVEAVERVRAMNIWLDDQPALRLIDVRRKIIQAKRKAAKAGVRLALVVLDYIQIMNINGENRAAGIGEAANGLADLAKRHDVALIALAQCNREADKKPEGADSMSDLNESGGIEAAAAFVALLHREAVRQPDESALTNYGELRIAKNRIGRTGKVKLYFDGAHQFFGSWEGASPVVRGAKVRSTHARGIVE